MFHDSQYSCIERPGVEERPDIRGLACRSPNCAAFVDGTKKYRFRPLSKKFEEERLSGHHKKLFYSLLVWNDVYGIVICVEINLSAMVHGRGKYRNSDPYCYLQDFFADDKAVIEDKGFQGKGLHIIYASICDMCSSVAYLGSFNKDIGEKWISNEWSISHILSRLRSFCHWCLEDVLLPMIYSVEGVLVHRKIWEEGWPSVQM